MKQSKTIGLLTLLLGVLALAGCKQTEYVPVPVERKLTKWERTKMQTGGVTLVVLAIGACVALFYVWRKLRKWARNGI